MRWGLRYGVDGWLADRLARLGAEIGLRWIDATGGAPAGGDVHGAERGPDPPVAVVVDLADEHALDVVRQARADWPDAVVVGYLGVPDQGRWIAGQRAGCDLVVNRGALVSRLLDRLQAAGPGRRRFPLTGEADVAGRLGLVERFPDTPVGPVALYHVDGRLFAVADRCPHAGAVLSEGELDHAVLTCPRHGSQFDIRTGERLRGPADVDLTVHPVAVAAGQVALLLD